MKYLRNILLSLFVFAEIATGFEIEPFADNQSLLETFSTNCLQMTQSQQMLKAYTMIGISSNFNNPKENLIKAIPIYDKRMHEIKAYFDKRLEGHKEAQESFAKALVLWDDSKKMLEQTPTKENALKIKKNFLVMIDKLLAGTKPLATHELELISLTGKLCRKPLEITVDYLMRIWQIDIPNYRVDVKKIIDNYGENIKTLSEDKLNNEESEKLLKKAKKAFKFFEFMYDSENTKIPSLLSRKADQNFVIIRNIKKIFKEQAKK